uniref:Uncharacterized protein n=1 Tax=Erwinia amylovora ATCC BAA-2158 TaxID=889211 RepID=E5B7P3_ERWAM|nr:hypothetical protein predicted by Glimmer/Critica [Erwinia amylovora ATCC BAA-2158]
MRQPARVCSVDNAIIIDPQRLETADRLWQKFVLLHPAG